ncbi:MAG: holo-ACP synthase [Gammaproteobacteria bacterium]|jgi:holo-[acyl-carrier protein] synthase|nr:MAG: holo-ACP synthase [Gammaproteobacteria bacterium TMED225]|tara:strand:+ start:2231 stop:2608 length:378 start_codon:yes stop_codon:yes gene_type:complete
MIFGIGTDLIKITRIKNINSLEKFALKILSKNELDLFDSLSNDKKITFISKQFAGKEAFSKALGTGISAGIRFKEIEILRDEKGKPIFTAINSLKSFMLNLGITRTHISITDEREYAMAFAILEK